VKWLTVSHREATWEDEVAIIEEKIALTKFIKLMKIKTKLTAPTEKNEIPTISQSENILSKFLFEGPNTDKFQLTYLVSDGTRNSPRNIQKKH
jgi:hypothetical protein